MNEVGRYFVLEGIDGAGKSSQATVLAEHFRNQGISVVETLEPGGTRIGTELRGILLGTEIELLPETVTDLFTAIRRETVHQIISPAVRHGRTVISDRNWFSTVAMQGFGYGLDVQEIIEQNARVMGDFLLPGKAVILDLPVEVSKYRLAASRQKTDRFEQEGVEFFEKVREGYHWIADRYGIEIVDATNPFQEVQTKLVDIFDEK